MIPIPPFLNLTGTKTTPISQLAISNDGTGSSATEYVDIPYNAAYGFSGNVAFSVSMWMNTTSFSAYFNYFIKSNPAGTATPANNDYAINGTSTGPAVVFRVYGSSSSSLASASSGWSTGTIYHVVGTFDGTVARLYRDAVLIATGGSSASGVRNQSQPIRILQNSYAGTAMNGWIDDTRIYNAALNLTQITDLYNKINVTTNLVSRWTWNGNGVDSSGVQNATVGSAVPYVNGVPGLPG